MDQQYSVSLGQKVRRGLEGRVLNGYNAGGPCYDYRNAPEMDHYGKHEIGVRLEIIPEQAEVVHRIFQLYASGLSLQKVAKVLRAADVLAPRPGGKGSVRGWSAAGIAHILRNKKYIGIYEYGRTTDVINPETGRYETRAVPEEKWVRQENPAWRIVSDGLWSEVQNRLILMNKYCQKEGGLNRTVQSQEYLFSGLISCGLCAGPISVVEANVRYGCSVHRTKGACTNAVRIRRDSLEDQLLSWLTCDLLQGDRLGQAAKFFCAKVQKRVSELQSAAQKNAVNAPELRHELEQKQQEAWNLTDVMAAMGRNSSPTLQTRLQAAETRMRQIEELLARAKESQPIAGLTADELREYLLGRLRGLQAVLTSSSQEGKQILRRAYKENHAHTGRGKREAGAPLSP